MIYIVRHVGMSWGDAIRVGTWGMQSFLSALNGTAERSFPGTAGRTDFVFSRRGFPFPSRRSVGLVNCLFPQDSRCSGSKVSSPPLIRGPASSSRGPRESAAAGRRAPARSSPSWRSRRNGTSIGRTPRAGRGPRPTNWNLPRESGGNRPGLRQSTPNSA